MEYNMSRKIDNVGRVLIPREILKDMGVNIEEGVDLTYANHVVTIKKLDNCCVFCGNHENIVRYKNQYLCADCIKKISEFANGESENKA